MNLRPQNAAPFINNNNRRLFRRIDKCQEGQATVQNRVRNNSGDLYRCNADQTCIPDMCVLKNGQLCICSESGNSDDAVCPLTVLLSKSLRKNRSPVQGSCICKAGETVITNRFKCVCPFDGVMTEEHCRPNFARVLVPKR